MASIYFKAENLNGKRGEKAMKRWLDKLDGVTSVSVNTESGVIAVDYNDMSNSEEKIEEQIAKMGYKVNRIDGPQYS